MILGPSSSRLVEANPLFVKEIQVRDEDNRGVSIYGFEEQPELSVESNWTVSKFVIVGAYSRQGFSLWMNKGSKISLRWEAHPNSLDKLQVVMIKGERDFETVFPHDQNSSNTTTNDTSSSNPLSGKEAEYHIMEDNKYYVNVINTNSKSIIMTLKTNVTSKMYDITKASNKCSTTRGSCKLSLLFPQTRFVILTTPENGDLLGWHIEVNYVARVVTYIAILAIVIIVIYLILKNLGACATEDDAVEDVRPQQRFAQAEATTTTSTETDPLMPGKSVGFTYGTGDEDVESGSSGSSDELYDGKICVICYDEPRNCFFVPCGHCATCHDCALRIMEGESRLCPICRRMIHKVRKLYTA